MLVERCYLPGVQGGPSSKNRNNPAIAAQGVVAAQVFLGRRILRTEHRSSSLEQRVSSAVLNEFITISNDIVCCFAGYAKA